MNRHDRRKTAKERKALGGEVCRIKVKPSDYATVAEDGNGLELILACFKTIGGGFIGSGLSDREIFDATATLIDKGLIRIFMHMHPDHIGASYDLLNPDTGAVMVEGGYARALEIRSLQ